MTTISLSRTEAVAIMSLLLDAELDPIQFNIFQGLTKKIVVNSSARTAEKRNLRNMHGKFLVKNKKNWGTYK